MRNTHEGAYFHQNGKHTACSFTGNEPPTGVLQVYLKWNDVLSKTLEWLVPNIPFPIKVKTVQLQNLRILTDKT